MSDPQWLSFTRTYVTSWRREPSGQVIQPVVAHAFLGSAPRSICNSVERESCVPATPDARRCVNCKRRFKRIAARLIEQTRHDVAASVVRHASLEPFEPDWTLPPGTPGDDSEEP